MIKRLTYFISLLILPSITLAQFQTKAELQAAVNLWVSNNATALSTYGEINTWDVSQITDMSELFRDKTTFNDDISNWNVSSVTDMEYMFFNAEAFNQPLNDWDVSSVTDMERMFESADIFNQDISNWNVSNVTTMYKMFQGADDFNQDISGWNVSSVTNMTDMFVGTDDLSNENKCAIQGSFQSNFAWPYDWSATCYDYKWFSSDSSGGPIYSWQDITSTGTQISMSGDDINTGPHPIGFSFPYYGTEYTTFRISTNGWISFTNTSSDLTNRVLPDGDAPEAMLALFWDDLHFYSVDRAYYYSDGGQLVVTFNDVRRFQQETTTSYTFQVILNSDGQILYQYNTMTGINASWGATIGWQDESRTLGGTIVHNYTNYDMIHDGWAVRIEDIGAGLAPPSGFTATASYQNVDLSWMVDLLIV